MPKDSFASGPSSNPSSKSYSGGGGGGVSSGKTTGGSIGGGKGGSLGVTTGKTIYGNTAYGPAGGMATGYATAKLGGNAGMGPSVNTYSNFRNLDGSAAIPAAGNMPAMGRNAFQARSQLQRQFGAPPRVGGLLSGEEVSVAPIPPPRRIVPMAMPIPPIPRMRPLGLTADAVWNNFKSWWSDPVAVKYSNPFTFGSNPAVYTPGPKPGQYGPQIPDNPAVYTPGPKPGQYGPQRPDTTPQAWKDFSNSISRFGATMTPQGR